MDVFCPLTYMLKHVSLLHQKNGSRPSCMDILFNKGSPKGPHTSGLPTLLPLKEVISYEDEEVNEEDEDLNRFDLPLILDDYGHEKLLDFEDYDDEELLHFEDYGDEELLDFEELGETSVPSSFCEEEEISCKEEIHLSLRGHMFSSRRQSRGNKGLLFLILLTLFSLVPSSQSFHPFPQNEEPQTHKCFTYTITHDFTSQNPKVRLKKFDGSFPMVEKVGLNQEEAEILLSLSEPKHKMFHKINPQGLKVREPKTKSDHKPMSPFEPIFNLPSDTLTSKALNQVETVTGLHCHVLEEIRSVLETNKKQKKKHKKSVHPKSVDLVQEHLGKEICPSKGRVRFKAREYRPYELVERVLGDGYLIKEIQVDESKIETIRSWPTPSSTHDVQTFHRLASFDRRFVRDFSTIIAPMIEVLKHTSFEWNDGS